MARKLLFESLLQQVSGNLTSVMIVVIGAVAFYYITRKKTNTHPRPPPRTVSPRSAPAAPPASGQRRTDAAVSTMLSTASTEMGVLQRIKKRQFVGSKICVVWEIFYKDGEWVDDGKAKEVFSWYAFSSDLYVMCKIGSPDEEKAILAVLKGVEGVQRHKILFCTTQKGYEAFARQINPALLITNDKPEAIFLSGVLPYIALVGAEDIMKPNVACVPSAASLACDEDA